MHDAYHGDGLADKWCPSLGPIKHNILLMVDGCYKGSLCSLHRQPKHGGHLQLLAWYHAVIVMVYVDNDIVECYSKCAVCAQ